ncbi:hypothetical protein OROMI_023492 [Orobanche minor]
MQRMSIKNSTRYQESQTFYITAIVLLVVIRCTHMLKSPQERAVTRNSIMVDFAKRMIRENCNTRVVEHDIDYYGIIAEWSAGGLVGWLHCTSSQTFVIFMKLEFEDPSSNFVTLRSDAASAGLHMIRKKENALVDREGGANRCE